MKPTVTAASEYGRDLQPIYLAKAILAARKRDAERDVKACERTISGLLNYNALGQTVAERKEVYEAVLAGAAAPPVEGLKHVDPSDGEETIKAATEQVQHYVDHRNTLLDLIHDIENEVLLLDAFKDSVHALRRDDENRLYAQISDALYAVRGMRSGGFEYARRYPERVMMSDVVRHHAILAALEVIAEHLGSDTPAAERRGNSEGETDDLIDELYGSIKVVDTSQATSGWTPYPAPQGVGDDDDAAPEWAYPDLPFGD